MNLTRGFYATYTAEEGRPTDKPWSELVVSPTADAWPSTLP